MARIDFIGDGVHIPRMPNDVSGAPNITTTSAITIDGADEGVAVVCQAPKTGNISQFMFVTGSTVTTGATMDARLESVDESAIPARPGGLLATNTNASVVIANGETNTVKTVTLTAVGAVTRGQLIALHVKNPNTSFGNLKVMATFGEEGGNSTGFPYTLQNQSGTWATAENSGAPLIAIGYDDGTWYVPDGLYGYHTIDSTSFSNSSTPDAKGARFTLDYTHYVKGVYFWINNTNGCSVKLVTTAYHQGNNTGVLAQWDLDKDTRSQAVGLMHKLICSSDLQLDAGTYRLIIEPTSASNIQQYYAVIPSGPIFNSLGGAKWHYTAAKDPTGDGSWTNYNNVTDGYRIPFCGLIVAGTEIETSTTEMSLSSDSIDAIAAAVLGSGVALEASLTTVDTVVDAIKAKTDNLPSDPADASDIAASFTSLNTKVDTIDTVVDAIQAKTDNLPSDPADASVIAGEFTALNTKVDTIDDLLDTEVAAIKSKTDNLPTDPADASDIAAAFATVNTKLDTIDDFLDTEMAATLAAVDTEVAAIKAKTDNLPSDPADASDIAASFTTVNTKLDTIDDLLDTEVAAIKAKTDNLPASPAATGDIPSATTIATAILTRSIDSDEASATTKCLLWLIALAFNKSDVDDTNAGQITVFKTDGTTELLTQDVTQDAVNPIVAKGEAS